MGYYFLKAISPRHFTASGKLATLGYLGIRPPMLAPPPEGVASSPEGQVGRTSAATRPGYVTSKWDKDNSKS